MILVVDDVAFNRDIVRQLLAEFGKPEVLDAADGLEALDMLANNRFPIKFVIADFEMPECHGLQLLKAARVGERGIDRATRFAMLTAFSDIYLVNAALSLDVNAFLVKPVSKAMLESRLADMLGKTRDRSWLRSVSEYAKIDVSSEQIDEWQLRRSGKSGLKFLDAIPEDWQIARKISVAINDLASSSGKSTTARIMTVLDDYVAQGALRLDDVSKVLGVLQAEERARAEGEVVQHQQLVGKGWASSGKSVEWMADMPRLRKVLEEIGEGAKLVVNIYTFDGKLFIEAGTELTPQILNIVINLDDLGLLKDADVAIAKTAAEAPGRQTGSVWPCPIVDLEIGMKTIHDIITCDGRVFLEKGRQLDAKSLSMLKVAHELGHIGDSAWISE
jgi:CheY-like chemotaxis protein